MICCSIDERFSFTLSASNALRGAFNTHRALHVIYDPSSGYIDSPDMVATPWPPQLISNPAGHQFSYMSVPQPSISTPPFFLLGDTGSVHLSSSGSILGASGPPEGLPHCWSRLSLRLTFSERSMHISIRHHSDKQIGVVEDSILVRGGLRMALGHWGVEPSIFYWKFKV